MWVKSIVGRYGAVCVALNDAAGAEHPLVAHIAERHRAEVKADLVAELFPKIVGQTSAAITTAADRGAGTTSHRADRLIDRQNDVADAGCFAVIRQQIAATRSTHALDQSATAQFGEQLLKIGQRD